MIDKNRFKRINKMIRKAFYNTDLVIDKGIGEIESTEKQIDVIGDLTTRTEIYKDLYDLMKIHFTEYKTNNCKIWNKEVFALSKASLIQLLAEFDGYLAEYKENKRCGHFSLDFYDYVIDVTQHQDLDGSVGVGIMAFLYDSNTYFKHGLAGGHAVNYAVTVENGELKHYIIEPQRKEGLFTFEEYFRMFDGVELELLLIA